MATEIDAAAKEIEKRKELERELELNRDRMWLEFSWLVARTKGDPHCRVAGCWGRGVIGLRRMVDTNGKVGWGPLYCSCAQKAQSDFALMEIKIEQLFAHAAREQMNIANHLRRVTFWGGIQYGLSKLVFWAKQLWMRLRRKSKPTASPSPIIDASVLRDQPAVLKEMLK